jgi:hypothetical protein
MSGKTYTRIPLAQFDAIPLSLPKYLILATVYSFPQAFDYDSVTNTLEIDCRELKYAWKQYVNSDFFDSSVEALQSLLDHYDKLVSFRRSQCGSRILQDMVRIIVDREDPCRLLLDVATSWSTTLKSRELRIDWGSGARVPGTIAPKLVREADFMEGARVYPVPMLEVVRVYKTGKKTGRRFIRFVRSGFKRSVEIDCGVYALLVMGATLSFVGRGEHWYFLTPNTPDKTLCLAVVSRRDVIAQGIRDAGGRLSAIPESLQILLLVSSIRALSTSLTSVTLYGVDEDGKAAYELRVYLNEFEPLIRALQKCDKDERFTEIIRKTIRMLIRGAAEEQSAASIMVKVLSKLVMLGAGVGPVDIAVEISRELANPQLLQGFSYTELRLVNEVTHSIVDIRTRERI